MTSFGCFFVAMFSGLIYLRTRNLRYDAAAAAINEVAFTFALITLITGMIWGGLSGESGGPGTRASRPTSFVC